MANTDHRTMRIIETPASNDVLCGKDKTFNRNIGNITYRHLIVTTAPKYAQVTTKPEKMKITAHIVHTMMHTYNSRFLKQVAIHNDDGNDDEYSWQEISITAARDKTSHALRFCAAQMCLQIQHNRATNRIQSNTGTVPVTPPTNRVSIRGRVQRKSIRYSPSTIDNLTPNKPIEMKKHNPARHRRTVSSENVTPMVVASSYPNPYYSPSNVYYPNDHHQYYSHNYDSHYANRYNNGPDQTEPIPMECASSTYVSVYNNMVPYHNLEPVVPYSTKPKVFTKATGTGINKYKYGNVSDDAQEDDLDAILREPIQWDDDKDDDNADVQDDKDLPFEL
jgi:hypothetical protein